MTRDFSISTTAFLASLARHGRMVVNGGTVLWTDGETDTQIAAELAAHNVGAKSRGQQYDPGTASGRCLPRRTVWS